MDGKFKVDDQVVASMEGQEKVRLDPDRRGTVVAIGVDPNYIKVEFDGVKRVQYYPASYFFPAL